MICCLFRWDQAGRRQQQQPSGPLSPWSVFFVSAFVSFLSVFLSVFFVSVFLLFFVRISVGISFSQYLFQYFCMSSVFILASFLGQHVFWTAFFGSAFFGLYFFGTAWFLGSVYCQCSFCKLEKYAFPSIEKRISF